MQIDTDTYNMEFRQKGIVTCNTTWSPITRQGTFTVTGEMPMIALRSSALAMLTAPTINGNSYTFTVTVLAQTPTDVEFFHFDRPAPGGSSFGLQVIREDGSIAFDAGRRPVRVLGQVQGDVINGHNFGTLTYPGKQVAFLQCAFVYQTFYAPVPPPPGQPAANVQQFVMGGLARASGDTFHGEFAQLGTGGPYAIGSVDLGSYFQRYYAFLVIDVGAL
ncbi:hypothetical protein [Lysobacter enzymogenes]|uniref:hypothetical protein n=1 Tax=Lysobacter enzymogenes TaxID=69 RepID=UPI0019CFF2BF|nr:hypothetical protein [Lysobacter enzymogenes]